MFHLSIKANFKLISKVCNPLSSLKRFLGSKEIFKIELNPMPFDTSYVNALKRKRLPSFLFRKRAFFASLSLYPMRWKILDEFSILFPPKTRLLNSL